MHFNKGVIYLGEVVFMRHKKFKVIMEDADEIGCDRYCIVTEFLVHLDELFAGGFDENYWDGWFW